MSLACPTSSGAGSRLDSVTEPRAPERRLPVSVTCEGRPGLEGAVTNIEIDGMIKMDKGFGVAQTRMPTAVSRFKINAAFTMITATSPICFILDANAMVSA